MNRFIRPNISCAPVIPGVMLMQIFEHARAAAVGRIIVKQRWLFARFFCQVQAAMEGGVTVMSIQQRNVVLAGLAFLTLGTESYAQQSSRRVGIGASIGNKGDIAAAPTILIPVQVTNGFRFEPEIAVFRSHEEPSDDSVNVVEVGVGVFPQMLQQNFRLYYGVRVGYMRAKETSLGLVSQTRTLDGFFVAPAVGGEYLFSDRFSLGAEVQFRHTSVKGDDVLTADTIFRTAPVVERLEATVSATPVLFVSRFYF